MNPRTRMLAVYMIGVFVGALDTSILGPALPLIAKGFHTTLAWTAWTVTAYTAAYVASTVLSGSIGDRYGRQRVFRFGVAAFGVASLLAVFSWTFAVFIIARVIQGMGAGAVYPNAQAEGVAQFPVEKRGTALGLFGAVFGLAAIIGPNAGGALAQFYNWPAIFAVNVPIAAIVLIMSRGLPESARSDRPMPDVTGGIAFSLCLVSALLVLSVGGGLRLVMAAAAVLLGYVFVRRQRGAAVSFLDTRPLASVAGIAMMAGAGLIGLNMSSAVFVPTLGQDLLHMSVLTSGFALMPAALTGAVLAGLGGVLSDRRGPRGVLQVGLGSAVVGGILLALPGVTLWRFIASMVFFGLGTAFTMGAPLNRMALALYRDDQAGEALSLVAVFRAVGLSAGPILLTLAQAWRGFGAMFGTVALASFIGLFLFLAVPDVRPVRSATRGA